MQEPEPNILVVDDNPNNLRVLESILRSAGYKVRPALNGEMALRAAEAAVPELVLLDIRMPGMDGFEVCRRLKAAPTARDVPVIFISALQEIEDKSRAFQAGGVDYIVKPFESAEVLARVHTHIQLARTVKQQSRINEWLEQQVAERTEALTQANTQLLRSMRDEHALRELLALSHCNFADPNYLDHALESLAGTSGWQPPRVGSAIFLAKPGGALDTLTLASAKGWNPARMDRCCDLSFAPGTDEQGSPCIETKGIRFCLQSAPAFDVRGGRRVLCQPLLAGRGPIGMLLVLVSEEDAAQLAAPAFVQQVAEILSMGIARRHADERLAWNAYHDTLTTLPNRRMLEEDLLRELQADSSRKNLCAILLVGLDDFKLLNDTLGHGVGDLLLKEAANRLRSCIQAPGQLFRWVGDEFIILLSRLGDNKDPAVAYVSALAATIAERLSRPMQNGASEVYVSASVGIALFPNDGTMPEELFKHVALALNKAKQAGRGNIHFFSRDMQVDAERRLVVEQELRAALTGGQFCLYFQPQVTPQGQLSGTEALIRWQHPDKGLVFPGQFIPVAESTGLIGPIGEWIFQAACKQLGIWFVGRDRPGPRLAINISPWQFYQTDFVGQVLHCLEVAGVPPTSIELEVTESLLLADVEGAVKKMDQLRGLGVSFALDDFGTGYSSLSYLKRLPVDRVKIDRSFVQDVHQDLRNAAIVKAIISLSRSLGMETVAEGVEKPEEARFLAEADCHFFQGYYFSKPLSADEFALRWRRE